VSSSAASSRAKRWMWIDRSTAVRKWLSKATNSFTHASSWPVDRLA
jgi:hypothetical protein